MKSPREPTVESLKKFVNSAAWKYIRHELEDRLELTRVDLESAPPDTIRNSTEDGSVYVAKRGIGHLQGCAEEIRFLIDFPEGLLQDTVEQGEEEESQDE